MGKGPETGLVKASPAANDVIHTAPNGPCSTLKHASKLYWAICSYIRLPHQLQVMFWPSQSLDHCPIDMVLYGYPSARQEPQQKSTQGFPSERMWQNWK